MREDDVTEFACARWPAAVRVLVLLGSPPGLATQLAAGAVGRLHDRTAGPDEWCDLEVALFTEVLAAWHDDRTPWWTLPSLRTVATLSDSGWETLEPVLDVLAPDARARLVLGVVAGLAPDQLDAVVGASGDSAWPVGLDDDVLRVAEQVLAGPAEMDRAARQARGRRRRRLATNLAALSATAAAAAVVVVAVVDPEPAPTAPVDPGPTAVAGAASSVDAEERVGPVAVTRGTGEQVVAWYDGSQVHVGELTSYVGRLASLRESSGVVFAIRSDGTVVAIADGATRALGTSRSDIDLVVSASAPVAAWIDRDSGDLTFSGAAAPVAVPDTARIVAMDGRSAYVEVPGGHWVVDTSGAVRRLSRAVPLAVAGGVRVEADGLRLLVRRAASGGVLEVKGLDARLSDDGRFLLTRDATSSSTALDVVVDVVRGQSIVLPLPEGRIVDSAFGARGTLSVVLARTREPTYRPDSPRGQSYVPGFDIVTCRLRPVSCLSAVRLFDEGAPPVLAH